MKSKYIQLVSVIIFAILSFVCMRYDDSTGLYGCLIMAKLCAMQYTIEDGKERKE